MTRAAALACVLFVACGDDGAAQPNYTLVNVKGRPSVHDAAVLRVTLSSGGSSRTESLPFEGSFPFTFSVSSDPDRSGDLEISVEALASDMTLVGAGKIDTTLAATSADIVVESTDFVVNTNFAESQYPSDDYEAHGFQAAAAADGTWTVAYRESGCTNCVMFARRFDKNGIAVSTRVAAGTNGFPVSTDATTNVSTPAIATAGAATLEVWDFSEPSPSTVDGIACRSLDAQGNATPFQLDISTDTLADVVSIAPLANSNFSVVWNATISSVQTIRAAIVRPDCTVLGVPVSLGTMGSRASVTGHPTLTKTLYAWIAAGSVHTRLASLTNALETDLTIVPATGTEAVEAVRVAPLGTGFAVVVRWALTSVFEGPGRIDLYRLSATGQVMGQPILVSDKSGSDFGSSESFGVTTSPSGKLFVTWHSCETNGDGQGCGVYGRAFNADATPASDTFTVPTTTVGDQTNPSVAALPDDAFAVVWKDDSMQAPDIAGSSVRARIVYLPTSTAGLQ